MDVKITSKARLESILSFLVHHSQNAFIIGRSIFDAIRTIDDVLEYAKKNNRPGILVAVNFKRLLIPLLNFPGQSFAKVEFPNVLFAMDPNFLHRYIKLRVK